MDRRSTNVKGFVHYGGDIVSGVHDGIGIKVGSASTGSTSIAWIEAVSDDTNANIGIRGQGAGGVSIGGGEPFKGAYSTTFAYAYAALTSGQLAEITLTTSVGDVTTGDLIGISLGVPTVAGLAMINYRTSTAASSRVTITVTNPTSTAFASTGSGTGRITWIDLT